MSWTRLLTLGAAVALLPVVTASAAPAAPAGETITVTAKRGVLSLPAVPTVGLAFLGGGDLFDEAGAKIGEGYSTCLVAKIALPELTSHCTSAFRLAKGEIHLSSLRTYTVGTTSSFKDSTMAVIGGTGEYKDARGEAKTAKQGGALLDPLAPVSYKFTITLSS
ncbi:allene oxide cyclase barrel-like domain-containing protein [Allokutzneria oryzae]|uniref:Allene oxide cyclase barrel-like domain-containing protein n=1 Tax=Allokutzneria oryzae TaxID=1378989 RepID=A0ABV5ZRT9_9PSEU